MSEEPDKIDDYVLLNVISTGKASQVREVMHEQSGQMMAMKLLLPEAMFESSEKSLLKHEYKVAMSLEHPNCCRSHGVVIRKTDCYVLMDLFKAPNLKQWVHSDRIGIQSRFAKLVEGVCIGLGHIHDKGWVHMDIKPENILLNRASEVRLIDFSLAVKKASVISKILNTKKGVIRGTRTYLAPETIRKESSTAATDIYSLGVTLFEVLTGKPTFLGDSPQDLLKKHIGVEAPPASLTNPNLTPDADRWLAKMLCKKPKDRYQSCEEILLEFRKIRIFKEEVIEGRQETKEEEQQRTLGVSGDANEIAEEMRKVMTSRRDSRSDAVIQEMIRRNPELRGTYEKVKLEIVESKAKKAADIALKAEKLEQEKEAEAKSRQKKKRRKKKPSADQPTAQPQQPVAQPPAMQQPMAPQQPAAGYYPQQQMPPGYPPGQQMPQGYLQPGMPQPGMSEQGYSQPAYPQQPGYAHPGYPQQPPAVYPQQGVPGYPQQQQAYPQQPMMPGQQQPGALPPGVPQQIPQQPGQQQMMPGIPAGQVPQTPVQPQQLAQQPQAPQQPAPQQQQPQVQQPPEDIPLMTDLPDIE